MPKSLDDLAEPAYEGLLVVENPATSSPGLAFLLATIARYGDDGWRDYWAKLRDNDVKVVDGWEQAYNGDFTQGAQPGRRYPLVVSYASSPPAEVYYAEPQPEDLADRHDARLVLPAGRVRRRARRAPSTPPRPASSSTSCCRARFQDDIPLQMFVFPVRDGTPLPAGVHASSPRSPTDPLTLPAADIGAHRDEWIEQWTDTVLR